MTAFQDCIASPYAWLFSVFLSTRDDDIDPCMGPPTARPLIHHKMAEFTTALINGRNAACNTDRPGES